MHRSNEVSVLFLYFFFFIYYFHLVLHMNKSQSPLSTSQCIEKKEWMKEREKEQKIKIHFMFVTHSSFCSLDIINNLNKHTRITLRNLVGIEIIKWHFFFSCRESKKKIALNVSNVKRKAISAHRLHILQKRWKK